MRQQMVIVNTYIMVLLCECILELGEDLEQRGHVEETKVDRHRGLEGMIKVHMRCMTKSWRVYLNQ